MSDDLEFRCPVCRAKQTLRAKCRRCKTDLQLVVRAYRRVSYLIAQRDLARERDDHTRAQILNAELSWLAPTL